MIPRSTLTARCLSRYTSPNPTLRTITSNTCTSRRISATSLNTGKMTTFYDLKADLPGGEKYDFATLKGKVVLIVNTASAWYVDLFHSPESGSIKLNKYQRVHSPIQGYAM